MTFYDSRSYDPTIEQLVGTPEEVMEYGGAPLDVLPPLQRLYGRCDNCWAESEVGQSRYLDELITLPDGSSTSLRDWPGTRFGDWRNRFRFKASCSHCGLTSHMPWGIKNG